MGLSRLAFGLLALGDVGDDTADPDHFSTRVTDRKLGDNSGSIAPVGQNQIQLALDSVAVF